MTTGVFNSLTGVSSLWIMLHSQYGVQAIEEALKSVEKRHWLLFQFEENLSSSNNLENTIKQ